MDQLGSFIWVAWLQKKFFLETKKSINLQLFFFQISNCRLIVV